MREPPAATNGAPVPEPAPGEAAARMEQVIDRFIWQDDGRETKSRISSVPPPIPHSADGSDVATDIVARLAPRHLDMPDTLPRIVTSSLPIRPAAPVEDCSTPEPAPAPRVAAGARVAPAGYRLAEATYATMRQRLGLTGQPVSWTTRWRTARRVLAATAATTCVFSTGVLWAMHRSEMVAEINPPPAEIAVAMPEPAAVGGAAPGQSIRNTPVLIREGASLGASATAWGPDLPPTNSSAESVSAPAPIVPRMINEDQTALPAPITPIAPVVRMVPVVPMPIVPAPPLVEAVAPVAAGPGKADAVAAPAPPLDRKALHDLAARPAEMSDHGPTRSAAPIAKRPKSSAERRPMHREHHVRSTPTPRVTNAPASSRGAAPKVARSQSPAPGWDTRRQGLRSDPEPEPSMFKKLIGYVWPPGQSGNATQAAKSPAPTGPAVTSKPFYWSDNSRARP